MQVYLDHNDRFLKVPAFRLLANLLFFLSLLSSASANTQPPVTTNDEDTPKLSAVYGKYSQEAVSGKKRDASFRTFWEKQFTDVLAVTKDGGVIRCRMLDELGVIQRNLGQTQAAIDTYQRLEVYARKTDNIEALTTAAENELGLVRGKPIEVVRQVAEKLRTYVEQLADKQVNPTNLSRLSNDLMGVGTALYNCSADGKDNNQRKKILERALDAFNKSVALGKSGTTPIASRMFWAARTLSKLGRKKEAAAMYGKLAEMKDSELSKLWMAYLQIEETTPKDSDAYRQAIESVLASHEKRGGVDDYEITLRHLLGLSYQNAKEYDKSTSILSSLIGKSKDNDFNAYNMLLVGLNMLYSGQKDAARDIFAEIIRRYPGTGSTEAADREVKKLTQDAKITQDAKTSLTTHNPRNVATRAIILIASLAMPLVAIVIWRWYQKKGRTAI